MRKLVPVLIAALALQAQVPRLSEVQERRLSNGARLLLVERRGLSAFHASLVFRGGRTEEPAAAAWATDLLARALFGGTWSEDLGPAKAQSALDALLKQEEGLLDALRLERLRLRRDPSAASQLPSIEASLAAVQAQLKAHASKSPLSDLYIARGGRQEAVATADALRVDTELPQESFEFWCRTEATRLRILQLSRFSQARAALAAELRIQGPQGLSLLCGAALPGHPYGRDLADHTPVLEALRWSDLRTYAQRALSPDRLTIIVVGSLSMETALPLVERHLGSLPARPDWADAILPEIAADLGDRRVQASFGEAPRLLVGWRIPPRNHPDHLALQMVVQLLDGGKAARLPFSLVTQKGLAHLLSIGLDVPGGRHPGLLVADLQPASGHSLAELDRALHAEILRLQQDPIPQEEWSRALALLETSYMKTLDEPAAMTEWLGRAWAEGGDWRLGDIEIQRLRNLGPEAVQSAARTWLKPTHRTTVWLEPILDENLNPLDAETTRVLKALAALRIEDPAQRELLVTEGLRQLRMLNSEERLRTLKLLAAQLKQEKP